MTINKNSIRQDLPSAEEVTNLYLYGQYEKPTDLLDQTTWGKERDADGNVIIDLQLSTFIDEVGRFVDAASFDVIRIFMGIPATYIIHNEEYSQSYIQYRDLLEGSKNPQKKEFSKSELFELYNLEGKNNAFEMNQALYDDGNGDHAERTYIWGSTSFMIHKDTKFIINDDGTREIKDFAITVRYDDKNVNKRPQENFDFEGGQVSAWGNSALEPIIDPSKVGNTVTFNFHESLIFPLLLMRLFLPKFLKIIM